MDIQLSDVKDLVAEQRNTALDNLAYMTTYAKALEARVAELEKPDDEPIGRHRKT